MKLSYQSLVTGTQRPENSDPEHDEPSCVVQRTVVEVVGPALPVLSLAVVDDVADDLRSIDTTTACVCASKMVVACRVRRGHSTS